MDTQPQCASCHKTPEGCDIPLKQCAKCKKAYYCSRGCQKADWKSHKCLCRATSVKPCSKVNPFTALENGDWLRDRPAKDTYKLLVDTYRMRKADQFKFDSRVVGANVHAGASKESIQNDFVTFLSTIATNDQTRAQEPRPLLLPQWWNGEKTTECTELAQSDDFSNIYVSVSAPGHTVLVHEHLLICLSRPVENAVIQQHYGNDLMPMQLRMFGEEVDGTLCAGKSGKSMRRMMVAQENGTGMPYTMHLDTAA